MKKILYLIPVALLAACSAPKYTASFQHQRNNVDYHPAKAAESVADEVLVNNIVSDQLVASTKVEPTASLADAKKEIKSAYLKMTKEERKEVRQLLKKEIKSIVKNQKKEMAVSSTKAAGLDHDLKLAAIFGAVGIVALLLGTAGQAFTVIGAIALLIGVVFFVKWLLRQ
jgi:Flp pilus assembly protein TadB